MEKKFINGIKDKNKNITKEKNMIVNIIDNLKYLFSN